MNPTNKELAFEAIKGYNEDKRVLTDMLVNFDPKIMPNSLVSEIRSRLAEIDKEIRELTLTTEVQ